MLKFQYVNKQELSGVRKLVKQLSPTILGFAAGVVGVLLWQNNAINSELTSNTLQRWEADLNSQKQQVKEVSNSIENQIDALSVKMAQMQARLVRLDSLGERVVTVANLDDTEFAFGQDVAIGGVSAKEAQAFSKPTFSDALDSLEDEINLKAERLNVLQRILESKRWNDTVKLAGHPLKTGYMTSRYGFRANPFHGGLDFHAGVDFAAPTGTPIYATGPGIVSASKFKSGYGNTVEITHADGKVTRYAHCQTLESKEGQVVQAGDLIATVGSTGNSTGPHIHYEVLVNGRQVNPAPFLKQVNRDEKDKVTLHIDNKQPNDSDSLNHG